MPLLGGLFSKKNKSGSRSKGDDYAATTTTSSNLSSPTTSSYITPDLSVPSYPNAQNGLKSNYSRGAYPQHLQAPLMSNSSSSTSSAGNAKLRFFGRKKSGQATASLAAQSSPDFQSVGGHSTPPRNNYQTRATSSEMDPSDSRRLRPPPSRSAIFAAYADPVSALSTRSLPNDNSFESDSSLPPSPSPASAPPRRPSLFAWGKNSAPRSPTGDSSYVSADTSGSVADSSFNLKSFRHVQPPSPSQPANGSNISLSAPIPRPRGESVHSDASQRISVAAFREAQARRSLAGSPSPSFRDSSPIPPLPRSKTPDGSLAAARHPSRSTTSIPLNGQRRRSSMAIASTTEDSDTSEEEESDDESLYSRGRNRQPSGKIKAKSELGHGNRVESSFRLHEPLPSTRSPKSHSGHTPAQNARPSTQYEPEDVKQYIPPRSQSSLGHLDGVRERPDTSKSSVGRSAPTQRAASMAASNVVADRKITPTQATYNQQTTRGRGGIYPAPTDSDSGSDSDDAPLATLVAPRRPGSALSSHSNPSLRSAGQSSGKTQNPPKPLIDINELTRGPKPRSATSPPKSDEGFTKGPTLLAQNKPTSYTPSPLVESPTSERPPLLFQKAPPPNFVSPVSTPAKEVKAFSYPTRTSVDMLTSTIPVPRRESSPDQRRDVLSNRLARAVKKSITDPALTESPPSLPSSPPISTPEFSPLPGPIPEIVQPRLKTEPSKPALPRNPPPIIRPHSESPPDEDLAQLLGVGGIKFISRAGEEPDSTSSESESEESDESDKPISTQRIVPIPIKQRSTPPSFAVTSRPRLMSNDSSDVTSPEVERKSLSPQFAPRHRSSTLSVSPSATSFPSTKPSDSSLANSLISSKNASQVGSNPPPSNTSSSNGNRPSPNTRQRSSTMLLPSAQPPTTSQPLKTPQQPIKPFKPSDRPFISSRRDSPASSTGDSSSGRAPYTPRDGSEMGLPSEKNAGSQKQGEWSGGASGLGIKKHNPKRRSVSFEDEHPLKPPIKGHFRETSRTSSDGGIINNDSNDEKEQRRRERRRSEAKAAIELGKVINGPGPVIDDEDDMLPNPSAAARTPAFNPMMSMASPMNMGMPMGFSSPGGPGWAGNMSPAPISPAQFMMPPPADPNLFAAHQQAMMYAKQAYQMAVAQQAMAAAGDEWERGSAYGGGSVYGGSNAPSMMQSPFGMMGGMMQPNSWAGTGSVYGGMSPGFNGRSANGMFSSSKSEYGGTRQSPNWSSSRSVFGESFGPSNDSGARKAGQSGSRPPSQMWGSPRDSNYFPPVPPMPASQNTNGRGSPDPKGGPRQRTASQPALRGAVPRRTPPPSSWKTSGA